MKNDYDFGGYATRNDLKCSDGRVIRADAFKESHSVRVPLVWQHMHDAPSNILGHAVLENRSDGVYAYGKFNDTPAGIQAKALVEHGDITALSIYANRLVQKGSDVIHGVIREVSLVTAGANPGAFIDNLAVQHADGTQSDVDDEAIIYTNNELEIKSMIKHEDSDNGGGKSIKDIFEAMSEEQKEVVYILVGEAVAQAKGDDDDDDMEQSAYSGDGEYYMKANVFDSKERGRINDFLTHAQFSDIVADAQRIGSFKEAFLAHTQEYGIENIDFLFPDAKTVTNTPDMIKRDTEWVSSVLGGTRHTPFSRIKSLAADITADAARAKGYIKAGLKTEEVIKLLRRTTTPTTVYKKQKLDRDDIQDITDLDVVAWLKAEMRVMLDEELARAMLVGDGRPLEINGSPNPDKIDESCIRPIYTDDDLYAHKVLVDYDETTAGVIEEIIRAREFYKGSGNPTMYTTTSILTDMLLVKDKNDRRLYNTQAELESALRVSKIVEVPVMSGLTREGGTAQDPVTYNLLAILVNPKDYTVGADKGGPVSMFDDFDIDYNQYKYLLETRCSGALVMPKSALIIEQEASA